MGEIEDPSKREFIKKGLFVLSAAAAAALFSNIKFVNAERRSPNPVPVASGGTGNSNITGIVKGNGVLPMTAAVSGTDIKTVGGQSIIGSGDVTVSSVGATVYLANNYGGF